jgi:hypothetical protein
VAALTTQNWCEVAALTTIDVKYFPEVAALTTPFLTL